MELAYSPEKFYTKEGRLETEKRLMELRYKLILFFGHEEEGEIIDCLDVYLKYIHEIMKTKNKSDDLKKQQSQTRPIMSNSERLVVQSYVRLSKLLKNRYFEDIEEAP